MAKMRIFSASKPKAEPTISKFGYRCAFCSKKMPDGEECLKVYTSPEVFMVVCFKHAVQLQDQMKRAIDCFL